MRAEEKILKVIENIVNYNKGPKIEIEVLDGSLGIITNNITIPKSMILFLDFLLVKRAKKVDGQVESGGAGDSAHTHDWTDKSEYIEPLKAGNKVAYYCLSKSQVLVLGRVE